MKIIDVKRQKKKINVFVLFTFEFENKTEKKKFFFLFLQHSKLSIEKPMNNIEKDLDEMTEEFVNV